MNTPTEEELIKELKSLDSNQARIDRINKDINSGDLRYKDIGAYELADLLGLDFEAPESSSRTGFVNRYNIQDCGFKHPYAENITYLENTVQKKRFLSLSEKATEIIEKGIDGTDLVIKKSERDSIIENYSKEASGGYFALVYASTELETTDGDYLEFSWSIGDDGDVEDPITPYDKHLGNDFDFADYIESDEDW
jgi:hypothetical protein